MSRNNELEDLINSIPVTLLYKQLFAGESGFYEFVKYFWDTIIAEDPIWNWHIKLICDELQCVVERLARREKKEYDYFIINVPPGSSKSTIISEMLPIWGWTVDPSFRYICGSYASTPAEDIADKCYKIYTSDKFREMYPDLVKNTTGGKTNFKNGLKGERYTTSTGSGITGIHAHLKIVDDPMSPQIAASDLERDRANKWISQTLGSRNVDKDLTVTIIVMQRLHEADTTGYLLAKKGLRIKHICIPAELSEDVKPAELKEYYQDGLFDPVRASRQVLITQKEDLGSYGYAGQMMQRPAPEGGGILKKEWFPVVNSRPPKVRMCFQIDPAYTEKTTNDPTGILGYYVLNNQVFLTSAISVWKEFPDFIAWLPSYLTGVGYTQGSMIYTEPKASGLSVVQQVKKTTNLNMTISDPPKEDKLTNVHIISPKVEAGRVSLEFGGWNDEFVSQVISFPKALHDEYADCLSAIVKRELLKGAQDLSKVFAGGF
ncbi:hypothetical protein [Niabella aurantiaca]|uniref:hypothetical protein n=1 Tax=Niabella aurantiaca TaxID=379900 RepID=UPI00036DEFE0|nr:hypothetical protein [Niabella aurantiaca]